LACPTINFKEQICFALARPALGGPELSGSLAQARLGSLCPRLKLHSVIIPRPPQTIQHVVSQAQGISPTPSTMAEKTGQKTAIIVGAGVGGVATAARLAKAGFKVTVFEKNDFTGGRCSLIHHDGYVCFSSTLPSSIRS